MVGWVLVLERVVSKKVSAYLLSALQRLRVGHDEKLPSLGQYKPILDQHRQSDQQLEPPQKNSAVLLNIMLCFRDLPVVFEGSGCGCISLRWLLFTGRISATYSSLRRSGG